MVETGLILLGTGLAIYVAGKVGLAILDAFFCKGGSNYE